jgi:hypothetical protein
MPTPRHPSFKPEPRDFKAEFERYLTEHVFSQQDYAAFLMTAKTIVFEREKESLLGMAINHTPCENGTPRILHRLRRHDFL